MSIVRSASCSFKRRNHIKKLVAEGYTAEDIFNKVPLQMDAIKLYMKHFKAEEKKQQKE